MWQTNTGSMTIQQISKSNGHYWAKPLNFDVPALAVRYKDFVVPDFSRGVDFMSSYINCAEFTSGDTLVSAKVLIGQIAISAVAKLVNDTVIRLKSSVGTLETVKNDGVLDEGFYLSFGVESSTDSLLNSGPPSGSDENPDQELAEYEIKRVGDTTDVGGGYEEADVTIFSGLQEGLAVGDPVNLVIRFCKEKYEVVKGDVLEFGSETLTSSAIPAGRRIRFGARNTDSQNNLRVRACLSLLY